MLFLEEGLFSWYTRHADEQQGVSCFRDTKASAGLFSGVKEKADILKKKLFAIRTSFLILERKHVTDCLTSPHSVVRAFSSALLRT